MTLSLDRSLPEARPAPALFNYMSRHSSFSVSAHLGCVLTFTMETTGKIFCSQSECPYQGIRAHTSLLGKEVSLLQFSRSPKQACP